MLTYSTIIFFFLPMQCILFYSFKIKSSVVTPRSFKLVETNTFLQNYAGNDDDVEISSDDDDVDKKLRKRRHFTLIKKFDETTTMTTTTTTTNSDHLLSVHNLVSFSVRRQPTPRHLRQRATWDWSDWRRAVGLRR